MCYNLFPHAEVLEDVPKDFVGGYLTTGYFGEGV